MTADTLSIYFITPNITIFVPKESFINFHTFKNHEELYQFLALMLDKKYNSYLKCIFEFIKEPDKLENYPESVDETIFKNLDFYFIK